MLNPGNNALALRIAETLKNRCTHETLPGAAEHAGFSLGEAISKRDRVLAGLKPRTARRSALLPSVLGLLERSARSGI